MTSPEVVRCPDGRFRRAIFSIGPYIADYQEQVWLAAIVQYWCPMCVILFFQYSLTYDIYLIDVTPTPTTWMISVRICELMRKLTFFCNYLSPALSGMNMAFVQMSWYVYLYQCVYVDLNNVLFSHLHMNFRVPTSTSWSRRISYTNSLKVFSKTISSTGLGTTYSSSTEEHTHSGSFKILIGGKFYGMRVSHLLMKAQDIDCTCVLRTPPLSRWPRLQSMDRRWFEGANEGNSALFPNIIVIW
jgi:hypothetical protein